MNMYSDHHYSVRVTLNFENGKKLVIEAPGNSRENVYVQGYKTEWKRLDKELHNPREL